MPDVLTRITNARRYCESCGELIPKVKLESWKSYNKRKYCNTKCFNVKRGQKLETDTQDGMPISKYIAVNSRNGRLMADFNLGVLNAVNKVSNVQVKNSEDGNNGKGIICTYKGVPVTPDMVKTANQWLMDNWIGKASQRNPEPEKDDRTEEQKMEELKYTMKELGYEMVKIGEKVNA